MRAPQLSGAGGSCVGRTRRFCKFWRKVATQQSCTDSSLQVNSRVINRPKPTLSSWCTCNANILDAPGTGSQYNTFFKGIASQGTSRKPGMFALSGTAEALGTNALIACGDLDSSGFSPSEISGALMRPPWCHMEFLLSNTMPQARPFCFTGNSGSTAALTIKALSVSHKYLSSTLLLRSIILLRTSTLTPTTLPTNGSAHFRAFDHASITSSSASFSKSESLAKSFSYASAPNGSSPRKVNLGPLRTSTIFVDLRSVVRIVSRLLVSPSRLLVPRRASIVDLAINFLCTL
mmetsp:Transcript_56617/g.89929  ORF Transcript_56617/g.89929 Transcript_56617/m.89929 type:complete len:291 (+) Transcript_56617:1046-1918(+)